MRMLTTYLSPTSGRATLAGHDVLDEPLEVRRRVGYLPENVPLYPEMRVIEYLRFRARLKDVPRSQRRRAIGEVIDRCQLGEVENRIIGQLSRGFRQRVGLAEAMVHDPAILILDEPTAGLDPMQIREVREPDPRAGRAAHDLAFHAHPVGSGGGLRPGDHHRPGPDRAGRPLGNLRRQGRDHRGSAGARRLRSGPRFRRFPGSSVVQPGSRGGNMSGFEVQTRGSRDLREAISLKLVSNGWPLRQLDLRAQLARGAVRPGRDAQTRLPTLRPRPSDHATRLHTPGPRAGRLLPGPDGLPCAAGVSGHRVSQFLGAGRHALRSRSASSRACATR